MDPLTTPSSESQTASQVVSTPEVTKPAASPKPKPKLLTSVLIAVAIIMVVVLPASAYFAIPTVRETVNQLLKINTVKNGTLVIDVPNTTGVTVFVNGEYQGVTPFTMVLPEGNYTVRLYKEGYEERFLSVNIIGDQEYSISDELPSINADIFQGWLTYRNDIYGFGFRYPSNWAISEEKDGTSYLINLSYTTTGDNPDEIKYSLLYEEKNISAYNSENLTIEETVNEGIGKTMYRKVGSVVVDTLTLSYMSSKDQVLTNDDMTLTNKWLDSVSFVNRNVSVGQENLYNPATYVVAPNSAKGNYLMRNYIGESSDTKIINVYSNTAVNPSFPIPETRSIVDPNGEFMVYSENNVVFAKDLATGKTVELFRGKSDGNKILSFGFDAISPNSKYLIYSVAISDVSRCVGMTDGYCGGDALPELYGWKAGLYLYDLTGVFGNVYLASQPFPYTFFKDNGYIVDWTNDSSIFYVQDIQDNVIYKYQFMKMFFVPSGTYQLDKNYYYQIDILDDTYGVMKAFSHDFSSYELWLVTDNGSEFVKSQEISLNGLSSTIQERVMYGTPKIFATSEKPFIFVENTFWAYSISENQWKSYVSLPNVQNERDVIMRYYQTSIPNTMMYAGFVSGAASPSSYVGLFQPIDMTISTPLVFEGYEVNL